MTKGDIDPPPFFKTWAAMYGLVLGVLAVLILIFYLITRAYQ
ncbi:hypothetical protein [Rufibacter radiotolerans]|nr:hypothetical protein [Rufibacter radiotolerans]